MARIEALVPPPRSRMGNGTSERSTSLLSHKLMTCLEALIPSCPAPGGSACSGGWQAPDRGMGGPFMQIYRFSRCHLPRFMAVYVLLFYVKLLIKIKLREFAPLFSRVRHCRTALRHGIDKAQGGRGTREWMRYIMPSISNSRHQAAEAPGRPAVLAGRKCLRTYVRPWWS